MQTLAKDSSETGRQELLRVLTDLFIDSGDAPSADQNALFGEVVASVLDDVATEARVEFSSRVANEKHLPKDVALKLAWDEVEVASPILQYSEVLDEDDLLEISKEQPQQCLLAISRRKSLGGELTDVIVARGNKIVVETMAANEGAQFSPNGYSSLAQKARANPVLQSTLVDRKDMSAETAAALEPYLDAELRKRLSVGSNQTTADIPNLVQKAKERIEGALISKKRDNLDLDKIIVAITKGELSLSAAVNQLAGANKPVPLAAVIATTAQVPEKTVSGALLKVNGMPLAVMCKALNISTEAFEAVVSMRESVLRLPEAIGKRLIQAFADIDESDARRTLEFLKTRQSMADGME